MVQPISDGVTAAPFRRVYTMHRYFARRPHNLFAELVDHYSNPGEVVLDPFFGGGVTPLESVLQDRRALAFDINPLARFIVDREMASFDPDSFQASFEALAAAVGTEVEPLFASTCPSCAKSAKASWFELSALTECGECAKAFVIEGACKLGAGAWECPHCGARTRFACTADTTFRPVLAYLTCSCGFTGEKIPDEQDHRLYEAIPGMLQADLDEGLWIPPNRIPDCNMQRESALHKKGITRFSQLFSPRVLLGWGRIRQKLADQQLNDETRWLWFAFSASLRYANRMVTRNDAWRGNRPLEWAKPGYWLPAVQLEVDPLEQMARRVVAIRRAKTGQDVQRLQGARSGNAREVLEGSAEYSLEARSSTGLPLPDRSVDAVITDPPYGSYVQYADLTNFWAVWLPSDLSPGLGAVADTEEEAVIARKPHEGAKTAAQYGELLGRCFEECFRVLKPDRYLVLTFNNREPRAWIALLGAAVTAGFELPSDGVIFQNGIANYAHTAQARRKGSVRGDFVYSFLRPGQPAGFIEGEGCLPTNKEIEDELLTRCASLLEQGPLSPDELFTKLYLSSQEYFVMLIRRAGKNRLEELMGQIEAIEIFDSHRKGLLERHFVYADGCWAQATAA